MSSLVEVYESSLPKLFPKGTPANNESTAARRSGKGFADIIEYHTQGLAGRDVQIIPTERFLPNKKKDTKKSTQKYEEYAVVLRRTWVLRGQVSIPVRIELEIQSESLCRELQKIAVSHYENTDLESVPIKMRAPFEELFFYRNEIQALTEKEDIDLQLRNDVKVLNDFIKNNGLLTSIIDDHAKYNKLGQVVSDILWTIFPPNSLVVVSVGIIRECWILRNVSIVQTQVPGVYDWSIAGLRLDFDGILPGMSSQTFTTPMLGLQVCKISDLPVVPIEYCNDWSTLRPMLEMRAAKLRRVLGEDLSSFLPQMYTGPSLSISEYNKGIKPTQIAKQIDERVIVDYKMYVQRNEDSTTELIKLGDNQKVQAAGARGKARGIISISDERCADPTCKTCMKNMSHGDEVYEAASFAPVRPTADPDTITNGDKLDDINNLANLAQLVINRFKISLEDFSLLFPALVPAFGLKSKEWLWLCSDSLQDVNWSLTAFDSLQLESRTKDLIECLVKGHMSKLATAFDDVIPGKGQGLVFLLHGAPGLGKTLTAESVADYLKKPLYSISGGELSTDVTKVEQRLNEIFSLTKRWDAVTLLDEADVLLCKRNSADMDRNAIVGVFLRMMEYFQGVLFLTTNRKEDFDDAFKSRIHVTITYPELSDTAQAAIWKRFTANLQVSKDESWTDEVYGTLGKLALNGRTIKNMLRTAVAYAIGDRKPLSISHVLAIVETELKEYMEINEKSLTPEEQAKREQAKSALRNLNRLCNDEFKV
ncbi:unnamed protein product [Clonostachys byssicola]|uniref:AAA+ ATPase domain-containing protein n=1 Tax=Clonostachys byssicola TaxID=160290 RepID=A0A9N9XXK4_9HYPO|nr:unnamed protein product [Clonostachys byssicola]